MWIMLPNVNVMTVVTCPHQINETVAGVLHHCSTCVTATEHQSTTRRYLSYTILKHLRWKWVTTALADKCKRDSIWRQHSWQDKYILVCLFRKHTRAQWQVTRHYITVAALLRRCSFTSHGETQHEHYQPHHPACKAWSGSSVDHRPTPLCY